MHINTDADFQTVELPTLLNDDQAYGLVSHIWTPSQWKGLRNRKQGPQYSRLAGKLFYKRADILTWFNTVVESNAVDRTAKPRKRKNPSMDGAKAKPKSNGSAKQKAKAKEPVDELA